MKVLHRVFYAVLAIWGITTLTQGCKPNKKQPPPQYFFAFMDSVFKHTKNAEGSIKVVDSLFRVYPDASVDCKFEFYGDAIYVYYFLKKDYPMAMRYADSQLLLLRSNPHIGNYYKMYSDAYISKADILFNTGDYEGATEYLFQAKVAAEKSLDPCAYSLLSYRLGMVMYKSNHFADAALYFKQAFGQLAGCGENFGYFFKRQNMLNYTALSYNNMGMPDSALAFCAKALNYVAANMHQYTNPKQRVKIDAAVALTYGGMAKALAGTNYVKAEALYNKSIDTNSQPGYDANDALQNQVGLARLYYQKKNLPAMLRTIQRIKTGLDTLSNMPLRKQLSELEWEYYDAVKDTATAYAQLLLYDKLKQADADSLRLNKTDIMEKMKHLEAEYQLNLLTEENKLKQVYLAAALLGIVLAAIIMVLLLRNWRREKNNTAVLTSLNNKVQQQNNELQDAFAELENQNNDKDRILGVMAHDLRNPIAGINSLIELVMAEQFYGKDQLDPIFGLIQNACTSSLALVNETLEFATHKTDAQNAPAQLFDVNLMAANCVKLMQFKAQGKKQQILLSVAPMPAIVLGNPAKLWRVLSNLITNAVKFSPASSKIYINTQCVENEVQVTVKDEGIGIPNEIKEYIFDAYTQAKRPGTNGEKPFGIGLSICKQIIESFNGKIWFESEEGNGTVFYFNIPTQNIVST